MQPAVLKVEDPTNPIMTTEEIFGPVFPITTFKTDEEAIRLANNSSFGLGASIWSGSRGRASKIAKEIEAGNIWINHSLFMFGVEALKVQGFKGSGYGNAPTRRDKVITFSNLTHPKFHPYRFPYDGKKAELISQLIDNHGIGPIRTPRKLLIMRELIRHHESLRQSIR
jgi:acyl-CoA reductase-like NAD-dependent aldehyde dehydrogenase